MEEVKITKLSPERWEEYKNLRLEALKQEPQAFASSYTQESITADEIWQERLVADSKDTQSTYLFAEINNQLVGMLRIAREQAPHSQHIASVYAVYVKSQFRGKGVGGKLLTEAINWFKKFPNPVKISLHVTTTQTGAIALYKSLGFETIGTLPKELLVDGKYYDVYEMEKYLK